MDLLNTTGKAVVSLLVLVFCLGLVVWLVMQGNGHNPLHLSALGWSFTIVGGLLVGLGIGTALPAILATWRPPS
jgi:uncharacterized membrane protein